MRSSISAKPIRFHWFKKRFCWRFLVSNLYLFFSYNDEILHSHFFCRNKQYFCQTFFSRKKYNRNIFGLLKFISMDFFPTVWLLTGIPLILYLYFFKNYILFINIATNISCFVWEEFHLVLLLATTWRSNAWVLGMIWLSECFQFANHFFLIIN